MRFIPLIDINMPTINTNTSPDDPYLNYCLWPYEPLAQTEDKLRSVCLLLETFAYMDILQQGTDRIQSIQDYFGSFKTVWGVKQTETGLSWEYYFYDYARRERLISATDVLRCFGDQIKTLPTIVVDELIPYFMCSVESDLSALIENRVPEAINIYIGNPGSQVSSGLSYVITDDSKTYGSLYSFFNAKTQVADIRAKINCSVFSQLNEKLFGNILIPALVDCTTICIANKGKCDTIYFSEINVQQLLYFLRRFDFPLELHRTISELAPRLDHLRFDVGFDFVVEDATLVILKTGFYGVF